MITFVSQLSVLGFPAFEAEVSEAESKNSTTQPTGDLIGVRTEAFTSMVYHKTPAELSNPCGFDVGNRGITYLLRFEAPDSKPSCPLITL